MAAGESLAINLTGTAAAGGSLLYELISDPTQGTLQGTPPNLIYTPIAGFSRRDGFEFAVIENGQVSEAALIGIEVRPATDTGFAFTAVQRPDSRVIDLLASFPATAIWTQVRDDGTRGVLWDGQARTWSDSYTCLLYTSPSPRD